IDFAYPTLTAVVPASVAVIKNGPNPENARAFVQYLLSDEGQLKLFSPEIGRLPVVPALYARAPKGYPNPFTMKLGGIEFDDKLFNDACKDKPDVKSRLETEWDTTAKTNYGKAIDRADQSARLR